MTESPETEFHGALERSATTRETRSEQLILAARNFAGNNNVYNTSLASSVFWLAETRSRGMNYYRLVHEICTTMN